MLALNWLQYVFRLHVLGCTHAINCPIKRRAAFLLSFEGLHLEIEVCDAPGFLSAFQVLATPHV